MQLLSLPADFEYWSFGEVQSTMSDGRPTPPAHDAMAAFSAGDKIRLVRNHEVREPGGAFGPPELAYDPMAGGGTVTIVFDPADPLDVVSFASLSGTSTNCAGGPTPWGSWLTCEETTTQFMEPHGYVFEVPASADAAVPAVPNRAMGRFVHEAVAIDPSAGIVYETEDAGGAGFYRFVPDTPGILSMGGLQMLAISGQPGYDTRTGQQVGRSLRVTWVDIDDVDPATGDPTVYAQGLAGGGATFRRLEGAWWSERDRSVYFISTSGGDAGAGQVWAYTPRVTTSRPSSIPLSRLRLVYESPSAEALFRPDNITVSPRGGILLCEDTDQSRQTRLQGLTSSGEVFPFAENIRPGTIPGTATPAAYDEFAGACFSPDGRWLFVNIQTPGISFAITGPWERGPL
jgi:secreted PhoX family phosphatase